ncbi:MAG: hypothetical protein D6744_01665 [Planctomycetota bacterium]|nr:MAG: hypothetical protein D6744_01665 [Planctomycetota bacterium]
MTRGLLIGLMVVVVVGCADRLSPAQADLLERGEQAYKSQRYAEAADRLGEFLGAAPAGRPERARALYVRGMALARAGRRAEAVADLERCVRTRGDEESVWRAYVVLATIYYEDRDWSRAAGALRAAVSRMPAEPPKDTLLFRLGVCYERLGRWSDAHLAFRELVRSFPKSSVARDAQRKLARNASHYAVQAGVFSSKSNAERQVRMLRDHNLPAEIRLESHNRTPRYIVLVGRYATYEQALQQLAAVKAFVPDAVIWP